jgi:hypothetical protein
LREQFFQGATKRMHKKHIGFILLMAVLVATVVFIAYPRPADAQCGSAASSCKSCHEVQKVMPVNTNGAWHTQHAFGDFCAFCHSGNTKDKDKAGAHKGMVDVFADVKGACQSCHPNDYNDRAKKYADALGKTISSGTSGGTTPTSASTTTTSAGTTTTASNANCGPAAPTGSQTIDLNKVYAGLDQPGPNILGNVILIGMIIAVVGVLAGLIIHYEKPLPRSIAAYRNLLTMPVAVADAVTARPELGALLPLLSSSDAGTVRAVTQVLTDRENGPRILQAVSRLDLSALADLNEREQKVLASLLTLAKEMKS